MRALSLLLLALTPALALAQSDSGSADDGGYHYYQTPEWVAANGASPVSHPSTPLLASASAARSDTAPRLSLAQAPSKSIGAPLKAQPQLAEASEAQVGGMSDTF